MKQHKDPESYATIDDILFENRNKEYGSYFLRKKNKLYLAIGFLISVTLMTGLSLLYFWYLNKAGDESVYFYSSFSYQLKDTEATLMDPGDVNAYLKSASRQEAPVEEEIIKKESQFVVVEDAADDSFELSDTETESIMDSININGYGEDSVLFGGILQGSGTGGGAGGHLDRLPEFPLGNPTLYVERHLKYPPQAIRQKLSGIVIISFIINKNGDVTNVKVEKSVDPIIDEEAVKTIREMPRWKPGMLHGKPINIQFRIPINFVPLS